MEYIKSNKENSKRLTADTNLKNKRSQHKKEEKKIRHKNNFDPRFINHIFCPFILLSINLVPTDKRNFYT